jgi:hypothetical protein
VTLLSALAAFVRLLWAVDTHKGKAAVLRVQRLMNTNVPIGVYTVGEGAPAVTIAPSPLVISKHAPSVIVDVVSAREWSWQQSAKKAAAVGMATIVVVLVDRHYHDDMALAAAIAVVFWIAFMRDSMRHQRATLPGG